MFKEKINFEIKPVFNLTEEMCKDFAQIDINSGGNKQQHIENLDQSYFDILRLSRNSFAFVAYAGEYMVGFTSGFMSGENMWTNALYVDKRYHDYGIGTKLLSTSEQAASLVAKNIQLIPLTGAVSFYQSRGYKNTLVQGRVVKTKKLPLAMSGVLPVFGWSDNLSAKLNVKVDSDLLKQFRGQPIFVYLNPEQKIDGVATRLLNGKDYIKFTRKSGTVAKYRAMELSDTLYMVR